jgi:glycosyltransferase involved in cell wall biosynthesis
MKNKMQDNHVFVICAYKESIYLEDCIKSLLNQENKSKVMIATSTPNEYIRKMAKKYGLEVKVNPESKGIGFDFDFALQAGDREYVTVAHQDDTYEPSYSLEVKKAVSGKKDVIICFTDYYEGKQKKAVRENTNLRIKRMLLFPLRFRGFQASRWIRRRSLSLGNGICCPAVTFHKESVSMPLFANEFKSNVDWFAWEKLSRQRGKFVYIPKQLMMHRVHGDSTTSEIIKERIRTEEDYQMFLKFWPKRIAKILQKVYARAEESNEV